MKKEMYVEPVEDRNSLVINTQSTFYRLYEVEGSEYNRFADIEVFNDRDSGITQVYIDGGESDLSFEGYLNELSETYKIDLDYRIQDDLDFDIYKKDNPKPRFQSIASDLHRDYGPLNIDRYNDGSLKSIAWRDNGRLHREDGPAKICFNQKGEIEVEAYHIYGKELSKSEFSKVRQAIMQVENASPSKSPDKPKYKGPSL